MLKVSSSVLALSLIFSSVSTVALANSDSVVTVQENQATEQQRTESVTVESSGVSTTSEVNNQIISDQSASNGLEGGQDAVNSQPENQQVTPQKENQQPQPEDQQVTPQQENQQSQPENQQVTSQPKDEQVKDQVVTDKSGRVVKDGLYVDIYYTPEQSESTYIPEFTLELWSVKENKLIGTAIANSKNYDRESGVYHLMFNHRGYKLGDEFALIPREADKVFKYIEFVDEKAYNVKPNTYYKFGIKTFDYYEGEEGKEIAIRDLTGTKLSPIGGALYTDNNKVGLALVDESGAPLKKFHIEIKLSDKKGSLSLVSDDKGMVWVDRDKLTPKFLVSSEDRVVKGGINGKALIELPVSAVTGGQTGVLTYSVVFEHKKELGVIDLKPEVSGNTDLSKSWAEADIKLTNGKTVITQTVNLNTQKIYGIPDGTYKVEVVKSKYANVKLRTSTVTVKGGTASLGIVFSPKYVLEVDKDGKDYNFSVINVDKISKKAYKGKSSQVFAVAPGESYMLKDNDTGKITTVAIDLKSFKTKVVLGVGVVFGGTVSTPHTGDDIYIMLVLFMLSLIGAIGSYVFYRKNGKISAPKTKLMSILLVGALLTSIFSSFAPLSVVASDTNIGGTPPAKGGATSGTPAGTFQTSDRVAVVQVGFIPNKLKANGVGILNSESSKQDLQDPFKFNYDHLLFYMAPNKVSDGLFRKTGSGVITFENKGSSSRVKTLYGKNPLYKGSTGGQSREELMKRTLSYADVSKDSDNAFVSIVGNALYNIDPKNPNRTLAGPGIVGESFRDMLEWYVLSMEGYDNDAYAKAALDMFNGYLELIKARGILKGEQYDKFEHMMREAYRNKEVVFFAQTLVGISVKDNKSPLSRDYAFMSIHDATDWYLWVRKKARPTDSKLKKLSANREAEAVTKGGASTEADGLRSPYKENGNIPFTFRTYARDNYARTLKPMSKNVPLTADVSKNPFGGWGYQPWGYIYLEDHTKAPKIDVMLDVSIVDKTGARKGGFRTPVKGWSESDNKFLGDLTSDYSKIIKGSMTFVYNGKTYQILQEEKAKFTLVDKRDNENINKSTLTKASKGEDGYISLNNPNTWEIMLGWDTPEPVYLHTYLGGDGDNISSVENKYEGVKEKGKDVFSNARLTLYVKAVEDTNVSASSHDVPEWRLSKYFEDISKNSVAKAIFSLTLPSETFINPVLSPTGDVNFSLIDPDLSNVKWAYSKAKLFNDTTIKYLSAYDTVAAFNLAGDLLAVKDNSSVGNVKLASWVNPYSLFDGRIGVTDKGVAENKPSVVKNYMFKYGVRSPYASYGYSETRYRWVPPTYDKDGKLISSGYYVPYTWSGQATSSAKTADYDVTVNFRRHIPKANQAPKKFKDVVTSVNGKYTEVKQDKQVLNINPEVPMVYDDVNGNTSVAFVAGDKMRQVQPVHYNVAQFVNVDIKPSVTGMSVATDANAKALASRLGANGKGVLYKGSAITTNFQTKGQLELKTFALDIGATSLKNAWNPSTTYSTDKINEEFLSRYATKKSDGTWEVTLNAEGKLKINGVEYGGKKKAIKLKQKSRNVVEHTLLVRGGKLVAVDGNYDLNSLPQGLKEALAKMHISTPVGQNIFNTFENGTGAKLTEQKVADLINAVRGTNDLATGKGWYAEDTTILVVREYTNSFELPSYLYTDKVPMQVPNLETPINKNEFFSKGYIGYTKLTFRLIDSFMEYDSSQIKPFGGKHEKSFVVGNVSVLDTFQ